MARTAKKDDPIEAPAEPPAEELGNRVVFALYGPQGGFQEPFVRECALADAVAEIPGPLFARAGKLYWLDPTTPGAVKEASGAVLTEAVTKFVVTQQVVNRGSADKPYYRIEYTSYTPTQKEIWNLLSAKTRKEGSLIARVREA